jgi:type VI secretion system protein ImpH
MQDIDDILKRIKQLPTDTRLEFLLADLMVGGMNLEDMTIIPAGIFRRKYRRDIDALETVEAAIGKKNEKLQITVNREGLYDALPEGLFHQPSTRKPAQDTEDTIKEMRVQRRREKKAREFFLPFEQEFFRHRILLEFEERRYFITSDSTAQSDIFSSFWQMPKFLNERQQICLTYFLPLAHRIVGDRHLTKLCFENILGDVVSLRDISPRKHVIPPQQPVNQTGKDKDGKDKKAKRTSLGHQSLGQDFCLAGGFYQELIPAIEVSIGPLSMKTTDEYLPQGNKTKILNYMIQNFIPFECDVVINIEIAKDQQTFLLSDDGSGSALGYTAFLG